MTSHFVSLCLLFAIAFAAVDASLSSGTGSVVSTPEPSAEVIDIFIPPLNDGGNKQNKKGGRNPAKVVKRAIDMEALMSVFLANREEIVVGFFDPPVTLATDTEDKGETHRKMGTDDKYQWWHQISMNDYNGKTSFVITTDMDAAYYFGMLPFPNNPSTLYFKEDAPNYDVYRAQFFKDGQLYTETDPQMRLGQLVPHIFSVGGWKFVPSDKHAKKMEKLQDHLKNMEKLHHEEL